MTDPRAQTGLSPSMMPCSKRLLPGPTLASASIDYNSEWRGHTDFKLELFPLHSPLLGESWLVSFPPLSYMLKFSGSSCLIWGPRKRGLSFHGMRGHMIPAHTQKTKSSWKDWVLTQKHTLSPITQTEHTHFLTLPNQEKSTALRMLEAETSHNYHAWSRLENPRKAYDETFRRFLTRACVWKLFRLKKSSTPVTNTHTQRDIDLVQSRTSQSSISQPESEGFPFFPQKRERERNTTNYKDKEMSGVNRHSYKHAPRGTRKRNLRSKVWWFTEFCNSHYVSHFAAFFIVARAKISIAESCFHHSIDWCGDDNTPPQ